MKTFKALATVAAAAMALSVAAAANATIVNFDDIGVANTVYPDYTQAGFVDQGYSFSTNSDVIDISPTSPYSGTGPAHSGDFATLNDYGGSIFMTQVGGGTFTLDSFFISGWFGDTGPETVTGYLADTVVNTLNYNLGSSWSQVTTGFSNVDKVSFNTSSNLVLLDDVSVNGGAAVPEPASWALMIGGFGLAGAALRRRRLLIAA
jgi:PEP-CTERM motif